MALLLDTHIALWAVTRDARLRVTAWQSLQDPDETLWVSTATIWEIAIKFTLKRRIDPMPFSAADAVGQFQDAGFQLLDIAPPTRRPPDNCRRYMPIPSIACSSLRPRSSRCICSLRTAFWRPMARR